jgi:simple sugar transport system ATP-binding protein
VTVQPLLELRSVSKRYGALLANDAVSLSVAAGQIHAVLGENGAGKSTLMKIIYGAVRADSGQILWQGQPVEIPSPGAARRLGIGMVYQHFSLFETISVAENIAVAMSGEFNLEALSVRIRALGERYGLTVAPERLLHDLSVGERQRVEILRCLLQDPKLLILDEPTAVLTPQAVQKLFIVLRELAATGCSILYISHKLDEIRALCDVATVLRGGRVVASAAPQTMSSLELARLMVGAELPQIRRERHARSVGPRLELAELTRAAGDPFGTALEGLSLAVHGGEVVGIAGISGNGQSELLAALSGESPGPAAMIRLDGVAVGDRGVTARRKRGLVFVPEERLGRGAVPGMSLADNGLLTGHARGLVRRGFIRRQPVGHFARQVIASFGVLCAGPAAPARSLSGGNLQKFIVGREMSLDPAVLIVAQPTWGVDVAAATLVRQSLLDLSRRGAAILVISEELEELFEICDRIAVLCRGRLFPARPRAQTSIEEVGLMMSGIAPVGDAA